MRYVSAVKRLELKMPPVLQFGFFALAMWWLDAQFPLVHLSIPWRRSLAVVLFTMGFLCGVSGVLNFRKARTTVHPGRPEHAAKLVTTGIYRLTRNPMYLGLLLMLAGWALVLANVLALLLLPGFVICMNGLQILPEERILGAKFGAEFEAYARTVRRWL